MTHDLAAALGSTMQTLMGFGTPPVLETTAPSAGPRGRGRPSYQLEDATLSPKAAQMVEDGQARSFEAAATALCELGLIVGHGSSNSKIDRFAKRAREFHRSLLSE